MARIARVVVPGFPHHVTQRGNRRQRTFFGATDYHYYLELLGKFSAETGTAVWAYCLMPNHVHLVLVPSHEGGLRAILSEVHRRYTRAINFREGWRGHLWQERFHSVVMDDLHTLAAIRYVECNPVAAGLSQVPEDWPWSSARAHLHAEADGVVSLRPVLDWVSDWRSLLMADDSVERRKLLRRHTRTGRPLGSPDFLAKLERITGSSLAPGKPGRPRREKTDAQSQPASSVQSI